MGNIKAKTFMYSICQGVAVVMCILVMLLSRTVIYDFALKTIYPLYSSIVVSMGLEKFMEGTFPVFVKTILGFWVPLILLVIIWKRIKGQKTLVWYNYFTSMGKESFEKTYGPNRTEYEVVCKTKSVSGVSKQIVSKDGSRKWSETSEIFRVGHEYIVFDVKQVKMFDVIHNDIFIINMTPREFRIKYSHSLKLFQNEYYRITNQRHRIVKVIERYINESGEQVENIWVKAKVRDLVFKNRYYIDFYLVSDPRIIEVY